MCFSKSATKIYDELERPLNLDSIDESLWNDKCDYIDPNSCTNLNLNGYTLIVLQLNIRSILSKQTELKQLLHALENKNSRVDILLLCETFLNEKTTKLVNIPNYTLISNHRPNRKGGGTCILIRNGITFKPQKDLDHNEQKVIESTYVEITSKDGKRIVVGSLYRSPNCPPMEFITKLNSTISIIKDEAKEAILGMDHNMDLLKANLHKHTQTLIDDLIDKDILPTITHPTRIMQSSATLIDNIFVSGKLHHFFESAVLLTDISDHLPTLTLLKQTKLLHKKPLEFESRLLTESKLKRIKQQLLQIDWSSTLSNTTSNDNFNTFLCQLNNTMDEISPIKKVTISAKHCFVEPWMTRGLEISSKKKHDLYKASITNNAMDSDRERYITYCNNFNKTKRDMRIHYYTSREIEFKNNTKNCGNY